MEYKVKDAVREGGAVEKVEISFYSSTESQDDGYRSESESGLVVTAGVCCCCCCIFLPVEPEPVTPPAIGGCDSDISCGSDPVITHLF